MAKITLKLNQIDIERIKLKGAELEKELIASDGAIYSYLLTIGNGYKEAVISGMGKTFTGTMTLKSFLGEPVSVNWKPNTSATLKYKVKNHWELRIWKATGTAERGVKVFESKSGKTKKIYAGISPSDKEAYEHAEKTEYGSVSDPGGKPYEGRALFTLLNAVFAAHTDKIAADIEAQIRASIKKIWG